MNDQKKVPEAASELKKKKNDEDEKEKEKEKVDVGYEEAEANLDSGYAWLILGIVFLIGATTYGASRLYGLVYARQISTGYYNHEEASWPIITASTVENLAGILTPALAQVLSWRQIQLLSTSLFIISNLGAYFSDSLLVDILCLGLVQGLALSTGTLLTLAINNDYFERFRTSAYGIAMSGSTFGVFVLAPLVEAILESDPTGFRRVYLAIALVLILNLGLAFFIIPRAETRAALAQRARRIQQEATKKPKTSHQRLVRRISKFESHVERSNSIAAVNIETRTRRLSVMSRKLSSTAGGVSGGAGVPSASWLEEDKKSLNHLQNQQDNNGLQKSILSKINASDKPTCSTLPSRKSIIALASRVKYRQPGHTGSFHISRGKISTHSLDWPRDESKKRGREEKVENVDNGTSERRVSIAKNAIETQANLKRSQMGFEGNGETCQVHPEPNCGCLPSQPDLTEAPDCNAGLVESLKLLAGPYIHCVWLMLTIYYLISRTLIIILPDFGEDRGLSSQQSNQLLNCWSLGELIGRLVLASLIDLKWVSVKLCVVLVCSFLGLFILLLVVLDNFYASASCALIIAALASLEYMLINAFMVDYLGKNRAIGCYSVAALITSLALAGRPLLIGLFRDQLGSYEGLLILLGGICLSFGVLFMLLEPLFVRLWPKKQN